MAHPDWAGAAEVRRLNTLYELLAALSRAKGLEDIYEAALTSLLEATSADRAAILLFGDDGVIRFNAWRGLSEEYRRTVIGHTPWPRGTRDAQPIVIPDVLADQSLRAYSEVFAREGIRALAFAPLALDAGVFGKLVLYYAKPHECSPDELGMAQAIAAHVALGTERKRMELDINGRKHLETASLHLAAIVESSDDAIISKDLNGIITSWNKGAESIFGYTAAEAIGKPVSFLAPSERLNEMPDILSRVRRGERVDHYETRRRRKDGTVLDISLTVSPIRDMSDRIIGASKIARDISDRKRSEEERAELLSREQAAHQTAELLNRVGPRLAAQLDLEKLVQEVTDMAAMLVGAEFGSFFHNAVNENGEFDKLDTVSGARLEAFAGFPMPWNTALFSPTFRGERIARCEDVTKDPRYGKVPPEGHLPVRSYLAAPVLSRTGEALGGLFFGHSLPGKFTEGHEAILIGIASQAGIAMDNARLFQKGEWIQAELRRSNEELRRVNQDLETFAYSASHDLQEPLRTIALNAQLLERSRGNELEGADKDFLKTILTSANRMRALTEDLLTYTKAAKYPEGPAPSVDSAVVLANTLENLKRPIEEAGATVTSDKLPVISIHESRLLQLFQNLIGNAIKYRGERAPRVHISAEERDGWRVFSVVDNGIGMDMQFAEQIFRIFKRLHGREQYDGSGVGLAICQRIVEQYGGRIWLERSVPGEGSTFCFSIPSGAR